MYSVEENFQCDGRCISFILEMTPSQFSVFPILIWHLSFSLCFTLIVILSLFNAWLSLRVIWHVFTNIPAHFPFYAY
jgi:hypothetical protein